MISNKKLRRLIRESLAKKSMLSELKYSGSDIKIVGNGNIMIDGNTYKLTAEQAGPDADVEVVDIDIVDGNLRISAIGRVSFISQSKTQILPPEKVLEIQDNVKSGKAVFTIQPANPDGVAITFSKLT